MRRRSRQLVFLILVSSLIVGCSSETKTTGATIRSTPLSSREVSRFTLSGEPDWLAADDRYVYVKQDSGTVTAIDPGTNGVAWEVTVPTELCQGIGVGFSSVWTCSASEDDDSDDLVRIDTTTHQIVAALPIGKDTSQGHIVTGFGRVWTIATSPAGSDLVGIDPQTHQADAPIPLGVIVSDLAIDDRMVWAASPTEGQLIGVDPTSRAVVHRVEGLDRLGGGPFQLSVGTDVVWVTGAEATAGVDRRSGKVVVEAPLGDASGAASAGDLWLHSEKVFLTRVDAASGQIRERIVEKSLTSGGDVMSAFGSLWVSASDDAVLVRVRI